MKIRKYFYEFPVCFNIKNEVARLNALSFLKILPRKLRKEIIHLLIGIPQILRDFVVKIFFTASQICKIIV